MATAVDDSARPPPSTMEAGPDAPSTAIMVYATSASVATTCAPRRIVAHGATPRMDASERGTDLVREAAAFLSTTRAVWGLSATAQVCKPWKTWALGSYDPAKGGGTSFCHRALILW